MIDLFSSQFEFFQGNKRNGRTTIYGKLLSIGIVLSSLIFLTVLLLKLSSNEMLPKIVKITEKDEKINEIQFSISPISFTVFINRVQVTNLKKIQSYFSFQAFQLQGVDNFTPLSLQDCQQLYPDESHLYYNKEMCLNKKKRLLKLEKPTQFSKDFSEFAFGETQIQLFVQKCIGQTPDGEACKPIEEIESFFSTNLVIVNYRNRLQDYNSKTKKLEVNPRYNVILLGTGTTYLQQRLMKSTLELDDGFFFSNQTKQDYISDFKENKHHLNNINYQATAGVIEMSLQIEKQKVYIEYPKITEILPQVQSLFNTLCLLGIFAKFLSEALIFQDLLQNYLQFYYQKVNQTLKQQQKTKINKEKLQISNFKSLWWYFKQLYIVQNKAQQTSIKSQPILQNQSYVSQKSNNPISKQNVKNSDIYADIFESVKNKIELKNVFKDLLELKTCIHFLLSEEQYAAIKKCGRNLPNSKLLYMYQNEQENSKLNSKDEEIQIQNKEIKIDKIFNTQEYKKLNHIEKMDLIDKNLNLRDQLYQKFKENHHNLIQGKKQQRNIEYFEELNSRSFHNQRNQVDSLIIDSLVENVKKKSNFETQITYRKQISGVLDKELKNLQNQDLSITDNVGSSCDSQRKSVKLFFNEEKRVDSERELKEGQ